MESNAWCCYHFLLVVRIKITYILTILSAMDSLHKYLDTKSFHRATTKQVCNQWRAVPSIWNNLGIVSRIQSQACLKKSLHSGEGRLPICRQYAEGQGSTVWTVHGRGERLRVHRHLAVEGSKAPKLWQKIWAEWERQSRDYSEMLWKRWRREALKVVSVCETNIAAGDKRMPSEGTMLLLQKKFPPEASLMQTVPAKKTAEEGTQPQSRRDRGGMASTLFKEFI